MGRGEHIGEGVTADSLQRAVRTCTCLALTIDRTMPGDTHMHWAAHDSRVRPQCSSRSGSFHAHCSLSFRISRFGSDKACMATHVIGIIVIPCRRVVLIPVQLHTLQLQQGQDVPDLGQASAEGTALHDTPASFAATHEQRSISKVLGHTCGV